MDQQPTSCTTAPSCYDALGRWRGGFIERRAVSSMKTLVTRNSTPSAHETQHSNPSLRVSKGVRRLGIHPSGSRLASRCSFSNVGTGVFKKAAVTLPSPDESVSSMKTLLSNGSDSTQSHTHLLPPKQSTIKSTTHLLYKGQQLLSKGWKSPLWINKHLTVDPDNRETQLL